MSQAERETLRAYLMRRNGVEGGGGDQQAGWVAFTQARG